MLKIIVESEEEKQALLQESQYVHDFNIYLNVVADKEPEEDQMHLLYGLDSEKAGTLMHLYLCPELIEVKGAN